MEPILLVVAFAVALIGGVALRARRRAARFGALARELDRIPPAPPPFPGQPSFARPARSAAPSVAPAPRAPAPSIDAESTQPAPTLNLASLTRDAAPTPRPAPAFGLPKRMPVLEIPRAFQDIDEDLDDDNLETQVFSRSTARRLEAALRQARA